MTSLSLILVILFNFIFSFGLLNQYGNLEKHNVLVTISVFISWFFSFNVIFMLPLDITSTIYNQCVFEGHANDSIQFQNNINFSSTNLISGSNESIQNVCETPWSYVPTNVLLTLWQFIYWSLQILTWIFLPIFQSYSMSGEFTTLRKIKSSLIENVKYYCFFGVLFIVFIIYYASKERVTIEGLKIFCISASNTFGLFLLIVLMGYGLVEIPRTCFLNYYYSYDYKLNYLYFKVAKLNGEKCEADGNLDDLLDDIRKIYHYVSAAYLVDNQQSYCSYFHYISIILRKCPQTFQDQLLSPNRTNMTISSQEVESKLNEKYLIKLNAKIKRSAQTNHRTDVQYKVVLFEVMQFKDIAECPFSSQNISLSRIEVWFRNNIPKLDFFISRKHLISRSISLVFGYILATFSVFIIWSEFTFFIKSTPISIFALIVKLLNYNYLWIEIFSTFTMAYLCACCFYTVFKVRIFNYYHLAKHHQTDEYSLIFCAMLLCRLASPLCLNFLSMIHLDSHIIQQSISQETAFTQIMGHMDTVSFISDHLFIYLPVLMSLFCVATFFKIDSKIQTSWFGIEQFTISDEITQDLISKGKALVMREYQKMSKNTSGNKVVSTTTDPIGRSLSRPTSKEHLLNSSESSPDENKFYVVNKNLFDDI